MVTVRNIKTKVVSELTEGQYFKVLNNTDWWKTFDLLSIGVEPVEYIDIRAEGNYIKIGEMVYQKGTLSYEKKSDTMVEFREHGGVTLEEISYNAFSIEGNPVSTMEELIMYIDNNFFS